jgi:hypothetical protein
MNNNIYTLIKPLLEQANLKTVECVKILLYKNDDMVFEKVNFDDDKTYQDPLFYAYFNNKNEKITDLNQILFGYKKVFDKNIAFNTDEFGRIYVPNFGWLITNLENKQVRFSRNTNELFYGEIKIEFTLENIEYIENTSIEILKYQIPLLRQCYFNVDSEKIDVEIEKITTKQRANLNEAYGLIKKYVPSQFELIETYAPKCVIFNVDTFQRNSFATKQAHGIGFFNSYQDDYNVVFFVDDIAHQTGHVIFNTLLFDTSEYFNVDKNTVLEVINMPNGDFIENRDLYVIFHALYTYYTSFLCLDSCISNNAFDKIKRQEAMGRIAFYINKCYSDLLLIDNPLSNQERSIELFSDLGQHIYNEIKNKWQEMYNKYYDDVKGFDMSNQPYNFTYKNFKELNSLN